jgi:hypothetical protein
MRLKRLHECGNAFEDLYAQEFIYELLKCLS